MERWDILRMKKMYVLAVIHVVSVSLARKMVIFRIISPRKNSARGASAGHKVFRVASGHD